MVSSASIYVTNGGMLATPVSTCPDHLHYILHFPHLYCFSASVDGERLRPLLEHNNTDVWGAGPDGIDIRMHEDLYQQIHLHFPECSLKVRDLEAFVRDWEKKSMQHRVDATWFEEYVSAGI